MTVSSEEKERNIRVLLITDDDHDYAFLRDILSEVPRQSFQLDRVSSRKEAVQQADAGEHDLCLLNDRVGDHSGLEILEELKGRGFVAPVLILSSGGNRHVDREAMKRGAADHLAKSRLSPEIMKRSVRYAFERARNKEALRVFRNRLRMASSKLLHATEEERRRIAKELHDGVGAHLTAVKYALEARLQEEPSGMEEPGGVSLREIVETVQESLEEVHRISTSLRPPVLDDVGLLAALEWTARKSRELYDAMDVRTELELEEDDIPETLKIVLLRLVQEALNNAAKHSGAERVTVVLRREGELLELHVTDNGKGLSSPLNRTDESVETGMGLSSMTERVELSGGEIAFLSPPGGGLFIRARWPLFG